MEMIKEVLKAIKSECIVNDDYCKSCPFNISNVWDDYCLFKGSTPFEGITPDNWELDKIKWEKGSVHGQ